MSTQQQTVFCTIIATVTTTQYHKDTLHWISGRETSRIERIPVFNKSDLGEWVFEAKNNTFDSKGIVEFYKNAFNGYSEQCTKIEIEF